MGKDAEEKYAMSPNELWTIVDENGDGTLTVTHAPSLIIWVFDLHVRAVS